MPLRYLSRRDVEAVGVPMQRVIEVVEEGFRLKGLGQTQLPPKSAVHPAGGATFLHAMPTAVGEPASIAAIKWVGGAATNRERGLPTISGLIVLNDPQTMAPVCVMDCTWVTAMRTAAANAVAMKHLARPDATRLAVIGCGVQGRSNLLAVACQYPALQTCMAWDPEPATLEDFVREMPARVACDVIAALDPGHAVRLADIVVTAAPNALPVSPCLPLEWLQPGAMAAPVDYNASWLSAAFNGVDLLVTDDLAQLNAARAHGYFGDVRDPDAELGAIVAGLSSGRRDDRDRTMAVCLGIAVCDAVTAQVIYEAALNRGIGTDLPL